LKEIKRAAAATRNEVARDELALQFSLVQTSHEIILAFSREATCFSKLHVSLPKTEHPLPMKISFSSENNKTIKHRKAPRLDLK